MMKVVPFRSIGPGYIVCHKIGEMHEVVRISTPDTRYPTVRLHFGKGTLGYLDGHPYQVIGVVYQPWPEEKTGEVLREEAIAAAQSLFQRISAGASPDEIEQVMFRAADAMEFYLLGTSTAAAMKEG